jgi:2-hydroxycyclohexanecarboxyl-CoA dehydrogenase
LRLGRAGKNSASLRLRGSFSYEQSRFIHYHHSEIIEVAVQLNLSDHVAIVTGGASGIGRATAECFLTDGVHVALWDVSANVEAVAAELNSNPSPRVVGCVVDVTDSTSVAQALERVVDELGPVDHVVHAAAVGSGKFGFPFTNLTPADWPRFLDVNIMGMVNVAHAVVPAMVERKAGTLVVIASVAGQIGSPTDPPYSASKAANINFAQCMAKDLAPHGIRVNTVCPGMVKTPLNRAVWQAWHNQQPDDKRLAYDEWAEQKIKTIVPLGKWQSPADIADMVVFLSSNRTAHVTGQTINVDGGYVMHW